MKHFKFARIALISMAVFSQSSHGALYEITEVDTQSVSRSAFPVNINESGDIVLSVTYDANFPIPEYNIPLDLSLIDFESEALQDSLTDIEAAQNGDFNLEDYQALLTLIRAGQGLSTAQKLTPWLSYVAENGVAEYIPGFDQVDANYSGFSKSVETRVKAINDNGVIVGTSQGFPYKLDYVNEAGDEITYVIQDHTNRGFVDLNGVVVGLESTSQLAGGYTEARDINNSLQVAGVEIFEPVDGYVTAIENCEDDEERGDQPVELCLQSLQSSIFVSHNRRAVIWELDTDGNVVDTTTYGLPFEPEEDDTRIFGGEATAINENGIAVGRTANFFEDNRDFPSTYAAVFNGDEIISFTDRNEYLNSIATDISDNNLVTGYGERQINGIRRTKFFVYDINSNEITFPDDFFPGSSSVARGINNNGQVVGEGEVETTLSSNRRREGFIYDHNDGTFQNLNELLSCTTDYTIVQAHAINDSGQIAALARIRGVDTDVQGNVFLDDDGNEVEIDKLVSVILNPIPGGEKEECNPGEGGEPVEERQGGTMAWMMLLLLFSTALRRSKR